VLRGLWISARTGIVLSKEYGVAVAVAIKGLVMALNYKKYGVAVATKELVMVLN